MDPIKFSDIINRIRFEIISQAKESHAVDEMPYSRFERYSRALPLFVSKSRARHNLEYFSVSRTPNESKNFETAKLKPRQSRGKKPFFVVDDWKNFKIPDPEQDACYRLYKSRTNLAKPLFSYPAFLRAL